MTVYDNLRKYKNFKKHDGLYGVEIETEAKREYRIPELHYWIAKKDNSLRDFGIEYIMKAPLSYDDCKVALKEFGDKTKDFKLIPDSNSTSVHVHMNMLNERWLTVANIYTVYALYENLLIRFSGPTRRSNLFCLPICDAEQTYKDMMNILNNVSRQNYGFLWNDINEETNKYGAINLASLGHIGSIEFRSFRGSPIPAVISPWLLILNSMYNYCRGAGITPATIIEAYRKSPDKLITSVFGLGRSAIKDAVKESGGDEAELVKKNVHYAAAVAYSIKDYNLLDKTPEQLKYKSNKHLDKYCLDQWGKVYKDLDPEMQEIAVMIFKQQGGLIQQINNFQPDPQPAWAAHALNLHGVAGNAPAEQAQIADNWINDLEDEG